MIIRDIIRAEIAAILSYDALEEAHRQDALAWIDSGADIFRIQSPDTPPKHLVSYFAVYDPISHAILLVDHIKAGLWLSPGGHMEPGEHPSETVRRECREELGVDAEFLLEKPLFVTVSQTVNTNTPHTDVSLWYILRGNPSIRYAWDNQSFKTIKWWPVADIQAVSESLFDPHMKRFIQKLEALW